MIRFRDALASRRLRSGLMVGFYGGVLLAGVLGVFAPSASAQQALPSTFALILWTVLYAFTAPTAAFARVRELYGTEALALLLIILGTALHGAFLVSQGVPGLQTGVRLLAGVMALGAIASALYELSRAPAPAIPVDPDELAIAVEAAAARRAEGRRPADDADAS